MRALALVAGRELRAYGPAWIAALVAALLPWLAPLLPTAGAQSAADVRWVTAIVLASLLGLLVAVLAGAGLLSRDLAEGRMGFFLALPLRASTVWTGRLLAAAILAYATIAVIVLPPALAGGELALRPELLSGDGVRGVLAASGSLTAALLLFAPVVLILVSHQLAIALRSRSPWLLVDLAGLALAAAVVARSLLRLAQAWATAELLLAVIAAGALATLALAAGAGFGLTRGGVLLARVHRAQASAIAAGLLAAAALTAGYSRWVLAVEADDLTAVRAAVVAPSGSWIAALGNVRHRPSYSPWMLIDLATGSSLPLSAGIIESGSNRVELPSPLVFGNDRGGAVWLPHGGSRTGPPEVQWIELGARPRVVSTGVEVAAPWRTELVAAGDRLVVAEPRRLSVYSQRGARLLGAAELPRANPYWQQLRLLAPERVRLARIVDASDGQPRLQVLDYDSAARRLETRVDQPLAAVPEPAAALSADGARLLLVRGWAGRGGVALLDAASGATLAELAGPAKDPWVSAGFLPGGRVAVATGQSGRLTLRLFDRQGAPTREVALGAGRWSWLGAPWSGDLLPFTASVRGAGGEPSSWRGELRLVDLTSGRVRVLGGRLSPVVGASPWSPGDDRVAAGAPAARLFQTADQALVRVDDAGRQQRLLPRSR